MRPDCPLGDSVPTKLELGQVIRPQLAFPIVPRKHQKSLSHRGVLFWKFFYTWNFPVSQGNPCFPHSGPICRSSKTSDVCRSGQQLKATTHFAPPRPLWRGCVTGLEAAQCSHSPRRNLAPTSLGELDGDVGWGLFRWTCRGVCASPDFRVGPPPPPPGCG